MGNRFVNPYHFVKIGDRCSRKPIEKYLSKERLTGWIEYSVKTLTPIFIPNTTNNMAFQKRFNIPDMHSYDFFSYEDLSNIVNEPESPKDPVIPGSEIRGVIRAAFEAVTNSCLSVVDEDEKVFRRSIDILGGKPAILEKRDNKWCLVDCEKYGIKIKDNKKDKNINFRGKLQCYEEGQKVWFKKGGKYFTKKNNKNIYLYDVVSDISKTEKENYIEGYFHKGEAFSKKHHESIFVKNKDEDCKKYVSEEAVDNFKYSLKLYKDPKINKHLGKGHNGYEHINSKCEFFLVYYKEVGDPSNPYYYISPAAIGREVYYNRLKDMLGDYRPCSSENSVCPACALFGFVSESGENSKALASRLRFGDAKLVKTNNEYGLFHKPVVLDELSSPKISASEFYLKKPNKNTKYWTYDYKIQENDKKSYIYSPKILGRKFYWHQKIKHVSGAKEKSERNVGVRPLNPNAEFKGKIYFNNITEEELNTLIWALTIGESEAHAHKIGMGKPLGLGSVRFYCDCVKVRTVKAEGSRIKYLIENKDYDIFNMANELKKNPGFDDFMKLTNYADAPEPVEYPSVDGENKEHYQWFSNNKKKGKIRQNLTDSDVNNPYLKKNIDNCNDGKRKKQQK